LPRHIWIALGAAWLVGVVVGAALWKRWQDEQRNMMGIPSLPSFDPVRMGVASPLAGMLLVFAGRVIVNGVAASQRFVQRYVAAVVAVPALAVLIALLSMAIARGVALRALATAAHYIYAPANDKTTEGILPPDSLSVSGSRRSFVAWDTLGYMGRDFV